MMTATADILRLQTQTEDLDATQTITELQIDLQNTIALANDIKAENVDLKKQLDSANAFSKANLQRHSDWKEAWKKEREVVSMREKQLEQDEIKWKARLEDSRNELKELKRKKLLLNSECPVDGVGLDLLKDVHAEHDSKVQRLTEEANKWRDQFYDTRKMNEELQVRHDASQAQMEREKEIAQSFQKELISLQQSFAHHIEESGKNNISTASSEAIIRDLKIQLENKELILQKLQCEIKDMQTTRDDAVCAKDELVISHQAELGNALHDCAKLQAKIVKLEQQFQTAKKEASVAISSKAEFEESVKNTTRELANLKATLKQNEETYKQKIDQLRIEFAQTEMELKKQLTLAKTSLVEEQAKTKDLERRCSETQEHAMKQISNLAKDLKTDDDSKEKLLVAQNQIIMLDNTITDLQSEMKQLVNNHQAQVQRLEHACESCHKDLNLVLLNMEQSEKNVAAEKTRSTQLQNELGEAEQSLQQLESKYQLLIDEKTTLSQTIEDLNYEKTLLESKVKCTLEQAEGTLRKEVSNVKQQLEKEKRRSSAYKTKAVEAHNRSIKAKELLDDLCTSPNK